MLFLSIVQNYLYWHYSRAFLEIFHVLKNFLWFAVHFFSIQLLLGSLFSPWKRIVEKRRKKWDLEDLAGTIIIGFISRVIGFIMRVVVILIGVAFIILIFIGGAAFYVFWVLAPVAIIVMLGFGLTLLIL